MRPPSPPLPPPLLGGGGGGGEAVKLVFDQAPKGPDEELMISLTEYFKCGYVTKNKKAFYFIVSKFDDITNKIIPHSGSLRLKFLIKNFHRREEG